MKYLVAGILKSGSEETVLKLRDEWNEHLSQPDRKISLMGLLRNNLGERRGYLAFLEADTFAEAESFMKQSPFYQNGLYERIEVSEFTAEIGDFA